MFRKSSGHESICMYDRKFLNRNIIFLITFTFDVFDTTLASVCQSHIANLKIHTSRILSVQHWLAWPRGGTTGKQEYHPICSPTQTALHIRALSQTRHSSPQPCYKKAPFNLIRLSRVTTTATSHLLSRADIAAAVPADILIKHNNFYYPVNEFVARNVVLSGVCTRATSSTSSEVMLMLEPM